MNKKKLVTTLGSLALVGAIGVGATLAYLSDQTSTLTNTFTVGNNINIQISETDINNQGSRLVVEDIADSQAYVNLQPGIPQTKDPRVDMKDKSNDAYVYLLVTGLDSFINKDIDANPGGDLEIKYDEENVLNPNWVKIEGVEGKLDGIYVYTELKDGVRTNKVMKQNESTEPLFTEIKVKDEVTNYTSTDLSDVDIIIKAAAVQTGIEKDEADANAIALLMQLD